MGSRRRWAVLKWSGCRCRLPGRLAGAETIVVSWRAGRSIYSIFKELKRNERLVGEELLALVVSDNGTGFVWYTSFLAGHARPLRVVKDP